MRGKVFHAFTVLDGFGITPAYAGKRDTPPLSTSASWDHPRLCGEKHPLLPPPFHDVGSPPPMRGKVHKMNHSDLCSRITPAYAGKRHSLFHSTEVEQDHPRLCGEKPKPTPTTLTIMGSPPPMRGKVLNRQIFPIIRRITPAYAGKSAVQGCSPRGEPDHPRLCGEKSLGLTVYLHVSGSPPPMRGKADIPYFLLSQYGITPAYAGKSRKSWKMQI